VYQPKLGMRTFLHVGAANRDGLEGYVHVEDAPAGTPVSISVPEAGLAATLNTAFGRLKTRNSTTYKLKPARIC